MSRRVVRALGAAAVAAAAGLAGALLGGCGAANVVDPVARAATVSNQAPGMRMILAMQLSSPALPAPLTMTGQGSFQIPTHAGSFSVAMTLPNIPEIVQALGSSTVRIEEVLQGLTIYMKLPPALAKHSSPSGKPWVKFNLAALASANGIPDLSGLMNSPGAADPSQYLRYLRATSGSVTKVGTASVDGFQTTEYRAKIQLDRVPNEFPAASRAQVRQAIAALEQISHVKLLPMTVWIDHHQLVRRLQFTLTENVLGQSIGAGIRIDIPQYGPQPAPSVPSPSQVAPLAAP